MARADPAGQGVLVVSAGETTLAMRAVGQLQNAGFRVHDTLEHADGLLEYLRAVQRGDKRKPNLVVVTDALLGEPGCRQGDALLALAADTGVGMVLLRASGSTPDAAELVAVRARGLLDVIPSGESGASLAHRLALVQWMHTERQAMAQRERALESEISELRVMESRLQHLVYHDDLTGLWNRRRLKETLELAVFRACRLGYPCSLILVDLDRFKLVNDLEGYDAGDRLLIEISGLLRRHAGGSDAVARIGSDEFAILLQDSGPEVAHSRAETIRNELERYGFRHGGRQYRTCASIGVAHVEAGAADRSIGDVMAEADQACFVAKQHGRNRVHCYSERDPELDHLRRDHAWAPRIREAIEQGRLFLCFQPIVRVSDGRITHHECLLRMRDPKGNICMPGEFIPVAERTGLIHQLDIWVVDRALDYLERLPAEDATSLSINLSAHAFLNQDLVELLTRRLRLSRVSPSRLLFEITETAAIENMEKSRELIARLRALGCHFALDDFGSGFSTFSYVKHFPVDYLKLDGSFVVNVRKDATDQELVRHMISIARSLGKKTIAEFVESAGVFEAVRALGVDYVQGHYIGEASETPQTEVRLPLPDESDDPDEPPGLLRYLGSPRYRDSGAQ